MIEVEVTDEPPQPALGRQRLARAVRTLLEEAAIRRAEISVAVVDDATMRRLHREYLGVDEPTDVLSFLLDKSADALEGEIVVSAQTAARQAARFGWPAEDELLLYVIHGALHLVGYDDATPDLQREMRRQERLCLARFGLQRPDDELPVHAALTEGMAADAAAARKGSSP